jgi:drug/metabolite transporter (DMT)-like permease
VSSLALGLVLVAAIAHATWNVLVKRVAGGTTFLWLFEALGVVIYAPIAVAIIVLRHPALDTPAILFMAGSGCLHLVYFLLLQRGYQTGDLSFVYPLARGTGPVLSTAAAIVFFGERPAPLALVGAGLVAPGVFVLAGGRRAGDAAPGGVVAYALLTGAAIAAYTLWDKHAVSTLLVPPALLYWGSSLVLTTSLAPVAVVNWTAVRMYWSHHRREALGIAILSPLSYVLVLTALVFTPVSYVAPAREISILIGAAMGSRLLAEGQTARRLAAATGMLIGLIALAVS